jgi:uncharacterized membrane protein (UPF0136 family)
VHCIYSSMDVFVRVLVVPATVCLAIATLLTVVMAGRYSRTQKVMPAGLTAVVSLCMSTSYVAALLVT